MRDKIWYELVNTKFGEIYLSRYIILQRKFKKYIHVVILLISAIGIAGWKIWEPVAWIAFAVIIIIEVLNVIENQWIRSNEDIGKLIALRTDYIKYFNKIEKLWIDYENNKYSEDDALNFFHGLRINDWVEIERQDDQLIIPKSRKLIKESNPDTIEYLKRYHS
jgi:hypothetical protein